jgi:hypothetical protein
MKVLVSRSGLEEHSIALRILARSLGNDIGLNLPEAAEQLAVSMGSAMASAGYDVILGPDCYINIYEKFGAFNHAVFVSQELSLDTRQLYLVGGDPEESLTYSVGDHRLVDLELTAKYSTQELFAELQGINPQPPVPVSHNDYMDSEGYISESVVYHRALRLPRGYGGLRIHKDDARAITDALFKAGIRGFMRPEEYHVTLMYDASNPVIDTDQPEQDLTYSAHGTGMDQFGEKGSRWEAIVIKLNSPELTQRHQYLLQRGYRHSYPDFKPHLSLKYMPDAGDLEKFQDAWNSGDIPHTIRLHDEYWEECDGD